MSVSFLKYTTSTNAKSISYVDCSCVFFVIGIDFGIFQWMVLLKMFWILYFVLHVIDSFKSLLTDGKDGICRSISMDSLLIAYYLSFHDSFFCLCFRFEIPISPRFYIAFSSLFVKKSTTFCNYYYYRSQWIHMNVQLSHSNGSKSLLCSRVLTYCNLLLCTI